MRRRRPRLAAAAPNAQPPAGAHEAAWEPPASWQLGVAFTHVHEACRPACAGDGPARKLPRLCSGHAELRVSRF
jgi:hypothetical protein